MTQTAVQALDVRRTALRVAAMKFTQRRGAGDYDATELAGVALDQAAVDFAAACLAFFAERIRARAADVE